MTNVDISYIASLEKNSKKKISRINRQIKNTAQGNISVPVNVPIDDSLIWRSDIGRWNRVFAHSCSDCSHYAPLYPRPIISVQCDVNPLQLCSLILSRGISLKQSRNISLVTGCLYCTQLYDMVGDWYVSVPYGFCGMVNKLAVQSGITLLVFLSIRPVSWCSHSVAFPV